MADKDAVELARARLAWISAGPPVAAAPRRDLPEEDFDPEESDDSEPSSGDVPGRFARVGLSASLRSRHMVVICILLLAGVVVAVVVLTRSQASEVDLAPVVITETAAPAPSPSPSPVRIRVHVLGAVSAPGVVTLPEDAIVADALAAAGGLTDDASPGELNLAARLGDGQQVLVGTVAEPGGELREGTSGGGQASSGEPGKVDLNRSSAVQLEELPGVGPVTAAAIVAWREENGDFRTVTDLQNVPGIGPKTFATLEPLVSV